MKDDRTPEQKMQALLRAIRAIQTAATVHPAYEDAYLIAKYKREVVRLLRANIDYFVERA